MTTTVRVLIEGNKVCSVQVMQPVEGGGQRKEGPEALAKPGEFVTRLIHGAQYVRVQEVGEFLT